MTRIRERLFYLSVGVGMALGTSVFTVVAGLFQIAPFAWVLAGMLLSALICVSIALSIGELASLWPSAPAIRTYFKRAFGNPVSLVLIYLYLAFIVTIAGVESSLFALVAGTLAPGLPAPLTVVVLLGAVIAANLRGLELPRNAQIATAAACVAVILGMGLWGGLFAEAAGPPAVDDRATAGPAALPALVGLGIFLFMGFEWVTPVGFRPAAYIRAIPWSMPIAIAILLATYWAFAAGISASLPRSEIAAATLPQVAYFRAAAGEPGLWLAGALSLAAIFSTFNAGVMGGARLIQAMAREGVLPTWCAEIGETSGAPRGAVWLLGGLAAVSSLIVVGFGLQLLAAVIGASLICFVYAAYMLAVLRLRRSAPDLPRPFRTPLPAFLQWAVAGLLPLVGLSALVSIPEFGALPVAGLALLAAVSVVLAAWSLRRVGGAGARHVRPAPARGPTGD